MGVGRTSVIAAVLLLLPLPVCSLGQEPPVKLPATAEPQHADEGPEPFDPGRFDLEIAKRYEDLDDFSRAREHYLAAGRKGLSATKLKALEGLERIERSRQESEKVSWLQALPARFDRGARLAVSGFDRWAGLIGRGLLVILFALALVWVWRSANSIEFVPFTSSSESRAKQLAFWLGFARGRIRSARWPATNVPLAIQNPLPYVMLPDLPDDFLSRLEEMEFGGVKVPIASLLRVLARPRVRVSGRWMVGSSSGQAFAEVECRRWLVSYRSRATITRTVPSTAGAEQDDQLELFAYDVLMRAVRVYES